MKELTLEEKKELQKALKWNNNPIIQSGLRKIIEKNDKHKYVRDKKRINELLCKAFLKKQNIRIQYYSLSSDEIRYRDVSIYEIGKDWVIAYCHLRKEERTFIIKRIQAAALLNETYKIPKNWHSICKVSSGK
jgi:predicted DNA-binding transcriptional regulator YafY